jgi:hypothetical protein
MARPRPLAPSKRYAWIVAILALVVGSAVVLQRSGQGAHANTVPYLGMTGMGMAAAPQPWMPSDFAITKHFRQTSGNVGNGWGPPADGGNEPMTADHGAACEGPPATHQIGTGYADIVFICHDHVMTAINSGAYGEVIFQPAQLVDFTNGPATVSISVSTRVTADRDWIDWLFVPFDEQLAVNTDDNDPENYKLPRDSVQVLEHNYSFNIAKAFETVGGAQTQLSTDWWTNLNDLTPASAVTRTPITFVISRTHLTVSAAGHTFVDDQFPTPLPFTQAVFQTAHHDYNPTKDGGAPNTWHWSNLSISSAVPYYLNMAMPDAAGDYSWLGQQITFAPAPSDAHLRFQWFSANNALHATGASISFDGGASWVPLAEQTLANAPTGGVSAINIWQPVPQGATHAILRGPAGWYARDFYVMAANGVASAPPPAQASPTDTPMPPMSTPTPASSPVPLPMNGVPCTVTINGTTRNGTCSGMFSPGH